MVQNSCIYEQNVHPKIKMWSFNCLGTLFHCEAPECFVIHKISHSDDGIFIYR